MFSLEGDLGLQKGESLIRGILHSEYIALCTPNCSKVIVQTWLALVTVQNIRLVRVYLLYAMI